VPAYFFEILMVRAFVAVPAGDELSLTATVKLKFATFVGVPVLVPVVGSRARPAGKAPDVIRHV
jgi:hypothetical protein